MNAARIYGLTAVLALAAGGARAQPAHQELVSLAQDIIYTTAAVYPMSATYLGIPGHDGELEAPSEAFRAAQVQRLTEWRARLDHIAAGFDGQTPLVDRDDGRLLRARLTRSLDELLVYQSDRKNYAEAATRLVAVVFTQFQHLPVAGEEGATAADVRRAWLDITRRLAGAPAYIAAAQHLVTTPCHLFGVVGARELAGAPEFLKGALSDAARSQLGEGTRDYSAFVRARDAALAALTRSRGYIEAHLAAWPENYAMGREAYDRMLKEEQLLPFDSHDVERIARDELAHGWAEEAWVQNSAQRRGVALGAASGGGLAPGGAALIDYYRDAIAQLRKFVTAQQVVTVPDWLGTMRIVETPAFLQPVSPGASMNPPRLFSLSTTGYYYITPPKSLAEAAARLDMNEDFDRDRIESTAAHEALPGHFMQLSIARRNPDFVRRIAFDGVFAEGWAFYGEEMFVRLGLYGDDLDARLFVARWERVRGARAVVDPQLASGELTYQQAAEFFAAETGFTREQAEAAVAGIATRPGYVIAYSIGRLQIENLLAEYQRRKGAAGSLRDFHDRLLSYGTTPLAIVGPELIADLDKPAGEVRAAVNY
ncbi:MAG TPA: DUF885 domain-containing protein [Steroidobacteraceae bacterium]|nr:DUF885 domain-containing protein [Steroidobacteraceae bacterium]